MEITWISKSPKACEVCETPILNEFYDARLKTGQWACLCHRCWSLHGVGLGVGRGQHFERIENNKWVKVDG